MNTRNGYYGTKATARQIVYMEEHAIWFPPNCSKAEATEIITEYQERNDPCDERHPHDLD